MPAEPLSIDGLRADYAAGRATPATVVAECLARIEQDRDYNAWIRVLDDAELRPYLRRLAGVEPGSLPLYGIPFAIKDNVDLAGVPTTAACPEFAYLPERSAAVVARLVQAGAIPLGKTNLDQFAAGLVGTRSPYGVCRNARDPEFIAGGSSAGSAVAAARGHVAFALGTDTAGSGRIPAAFNGLVGFKPSRGLLSTAGVVPACATLDCVSLFSGSATDAHRVFEVARGFEPADPFSRRALSQAAPLPDSFRFGVPRPDQLEFFGNSAYSEAFAAAVARMRSLGGEPVEVDFAPFAAAARLLYDGPWLAERFVAIESFLAAHAEAVHPITRRIIEPGRNLTAAAAFRADYQLRALAREAEAVLGSVAFLLTPTAGTHYRIDAVLEDPVRLNSNLGYYTNYLNLLDMCAVALPASELPGGLPFGITCAAPAGSDERLLALAGRWLSEPATLSTAAGGYLPLVVCGAHMSGLPLNGELLARGGRLREATRTAPDYRLYALAGGPPRRPGLVREPGSGTAIEVEVWDLPTAEVGAFLAGVPAPLAIGRVELVDGAWTSGFVCEPWALNGAEEITHLGGWRRFLERG